VSRFFIEHPIVAQVLAILTMIAGAVMIFRLPIAQFPNLSPPQVVVTSVYIGANAQTVESAVTIPLEQTINGSRSRNSRRSPRPRSRRPPRTPAPTLSPSSSRSPRRSTSR